jgi:hypothetical protein
MTAFSTAFWFWWFVAVVLTWLIPELIFIAIAHYRGEKNVQEWTLSDTIRRWSKQYRWLAPLFCGTAVFLCVHFFAMGNQ